MNDKIYKIASTSQSLSNLKISRSSSHWQIYLSKVVFDRMKILKSVRITLVTRDTTLPNQEAISSFYFHQEWAQNDTQEKEQNFVEVLEVAGIQNPFKDVEVHTDPKKHRYERVSTLQLKMYYASVALDK